MRKAAKSRAEGLFTATQKKDQLVHKEREKALQDRAEHTAKLRALRLAKEAADKETAEKAAAEKAAAKKAAPRKKKTPISPAAL